MGFLSYFSDVTKALQQVAGSDGRLNVSSRTDGRAYYISRDEGQAYAMTYEHSAAANGQYSFYLQNTSTTGKTLVISSVGVNTDNIARVKFHFVTGTAGDGVARVPANLNHDSQFEATVNALHDGGGTTISGLTVEGIPIDDIRLGANVHEELRLSDRIRLGQNSAVALELDTGTSTPLVHGVVFFYFE